jgi:hypothetical protein
MEIEYESKVKIELTLEEACNIFHELTKHKFNTNSALLSLYNQLDDITEEILDEYLCCELEIYGYINNTEEEFDEDEESGEDKTTIDDR